MSHRVYNMKNNDSMHQIGAQRDRQREAEYKRSRLHLQCVIICAAVLFVVLLFCEKGVPPPSAPLNTCAAQESDEPLAPPTSEEMPFDAIVTYRIYDISDEAKAAGGEFPENLQVYTFNVCLKYGIEYETVFALIERESKFDACAVGDAGDAVGLMQIHEKWHSDRMERLGATDLFDPYQNILVGVDFLAELRDAVEARGSENVTADMLAAYNYGLRGASEKLWARGVHIYTYNAEIMERASELRRTYKTESEGRK